MPVIVISMMLVVVGFVTLMLGVLGVGDSPLDFVYVSIGACIVAAVLLVAGVVRGRPSKKPVASSGGQGGDASWAGASAWSEQDSSTGVLEREEQPARPTAERTGGTPNVPVEAARDAAGDSGVRADDAAFAPVPTTPQDQSDPDVTPEAADAERGEASSGATPAPADVDLAVVLSKVSGVGPAKQRLLEQRFGSLEGLRGASKADLVELDGISPSLADRIRLAVR